MNHNPLTPLNSASAAISTGQLTAMLERASVFEVAELEAEVNAWLERTGKRWRFVAPGKIDLFSQPSLALSKNPAISACSTVTHWDKWTWQTCLAVSDADRRIYVGATHRPLACDLFG